MAASAVGFLVIFWLLVIALRRMFPPDWIIERLLKEWPVIRQAPITFVLITVLLLVVVSLVAVPAIYLMFRVRLHSLAARISLYQEQLTLHGKTDAPSTEPWLEKIAEEDRLELDEFVYVAGCKLTMALEGESPYLLFNFYIINCAVYAVTFDPVFDGFISYGNRKLEREKFSHNIYIPRNLAHGWNCHFHIRQELSRSDADFISDDPNPRAHYFNFHNLRITVRGDNTHRSVPPTAKRQQFPQRPNMSHDSRFHCRSATDGRVNPAKVIERKIERHHCMVVGPLLTESIR